MERNRTERRIEGAARTAEAAPGAKASQAGGPTPRECVNALMNEVAGPLLRSVRETWRTQIPAGMSLAQFRTLMFIAGNGGTSLREVANYFSVSMPTASATVARLVGQGLVAVSDHVGDRRRIALFATKAGALIWDEGSKHAYTAFAKAAARLSGEERMDLMRGIKVIATVISRLPSVSAGRKARAPGK